MKIGVMQPYFFPYIGYWQLLNAVDRYVVLNDVNYIQRGWINRNRILCQGQPLYINIPIAHASQNRKINEIKVLKDPRHREKLLRTLKQCYSKAPYFEVAFPLISKLLLDEEEALDRYLATIMRAICDYLQIETPMVFSSELGIRQGLHGEERILDICRLLNASKYYNAIGGRELYHKEQFASRGISLYFLAADPIYYPQFQNEFQENLSILDMMMFCSQAQIREYLSAYSLIYT